MCDFCCLNLSVLSFFDSFGFFAANVCLAFICTSTLSGDTSHGACKLFQRLEPENFIFSGVGKTHKDAASVRATHAIPAACGIYYFEVRIVSKGRDG